MYNTFISFLLKGVIDIISQIPQLRSILRITLCLISLFMILSYTLHVRAASDPANEQITVYVDQLTVEFNVAPLIKNGTTLVPFRALFEALGMKVEWDSSEKLVTGYNELLHISLTIGEKTATVNDEPFALLEAPEIIDGNSVIPLRFVSEASGASVFWDPHFKEILVFSIEYMEKHSVDREELAKAMEEFIANRASNPIPQPTEPVQPDDQDDLNGVYAHWTADLLGYCGGLCWSYYTFLPDQQVYTKEPIDGPDAISCEIDECLTYSIEGSQISFSDGETKTFEKVNDEEVIINGNKFQKLQPEDNLQLDGEYRSFQYTSNNMGGGVAAEAKYIFHPDGRFYDGRWAAGMTDGSETGGDGSGVSTIVVGDEQTGSGTYEIAGNTIILTYEDGEIEQKLFFLPNRDGDVKMIRLGSSDYLLQE